MNKELTFYILKVKGEAKIPDYVQVRDENFSLIGYFRPDNPKKLSKYKEDSEKILAEISKKIPDIPFGKVTKIKVCI